MPGKCAPKYVLSSLRLFEHVSRWLNWLNLPLGFDCCFGHADNSCIGRTQFHVVPYTYTVLLISRSFYICAFHVPWSRVRELNPPCFRRSL